MIKCYYIYNYNFFYNVCQYFPRQKNDVKTSFYSNQQRIICFFYNNVLNTYLGSLLHLLYRVI